MNRSISARHIIPAVCYALLFSGFILITVLAFALDFSNSEVLKDTGMLGLIVLLFAAAVKGVLIVIGVGGAVMLLFPLIFSAANITKQQRKLTVACLVFDVLLTIIYLPAFLLSLPTVNALIFGSGFALVLTALISNACALKKAQL